jgi:hypothetical protein
MFKRFIFALFAPSIFLGTLAFAMHQTPSMRIGLLTDFALPFDLEPAQITKVEVDLLGILTPDSCQLVLNKYAKGKEIQLLISLPFTTSDYAIESALMTKEQHVRKRVDRWHQHQIPSFLYQEQGYTVFRVLFTEHQSNMRVCIDLVARSEQANQLEESFVQEAHFVLTRLKD